MKIVLCSTLAATLLIFGCGSATEEKPAAQSAPAEQAAEEHRHQDESIQLNNGEKWKVDENMMIHIRQMEKDVNEFNGKNLADYKILSEKLKTNLDLLTSGCTMTGQAHDELHKWLVPFIDLVNEFAEVKIEKDASEYYQKIKVSFTSLNKYFQ